MHRSSPVPADPAFPRPAHAGRKPRAALAAMLVPLVAAACGGGDGSDPPNGGPPTGPTPAIALQLSPGALSVEAGSSGQVTATVTGTGGFTGAVTLTVEGAPSGVTATGGTVTVGTGAASGTVGVTAASGTGAGSHTLTVRARATGVSDQTASLALTLTVPDGGGNGGGGSGTLGFDFSMCPAEQHPLWFAGQTGNGPWTRVTPVGQVYTFPVSGDGGYAWHARPGGQFITQVIYFHAGELPVSPVVMCPFGTATMTGTAAGLALTDLANVSVGGGTAVVTGATPAIEITRANTGTHDLVGYRQSLLDPGGPGERVLIRRDVAVSDGGSLGTVDFGGSEAFAPATATLTVENTGGHTLVHLMGYETGTTCESSSLYTGSVGTASQVTVRGVPADRQRPTDLHTFTATVADPAGTRIVQSWFHALGDLTLEAPPLVTPSFSALSGPYMRLRTTVQVPAVYTAGVSGNVFAGIEAGGRRLMVASTFGRLSPPNVTLDMPDFTGTDGWDASWVPASGSPVQTIVQVTGNNLPGESANRFCMDGGWLKSVQVMGQFP
jgi:hypothetical protein